MRFNAGTIAILIAAGYALLCFGERLTGGGSDSLTVLRWGGITVRDTTRSFVLSQPRAPFLR